MFYRLSRWVHLIFSVKTILWKFYVTDYEKCDTWSEYSNKYENSHIETSEYSFKKNIYIKIKDIWNKIFKIFKSISNFIYYNLECT